MLKLKTTQEMVNEYAKELAIELLTDIGSLPSRKVGNKDSGEQYWKANAKIVELICSFYGVEVL